MIPHLVEEVPDFKAFIKPYIVDGKDLLVGHTKPQQFRFYMRDDGLPALQYKLLCTTPNWTPPEGILIWRTNENNKAMLPDGEPKPCKPNPMKNEEEIIKGISGFINYWKGLCAEDNTEVVRGQYGRLIPYWECVLSNLRNPTHVTPSVLKQGFWPNSRATILQSQAMYFCNGDVREEFDVDESYVGPLRDRPQPSFRVAVDCHEGYMVLLRPGDEEFPKPIWLAKALSDPNFVSTSPHFRQIQVEYFRPCGKNVDILRHYTGWDTKKSFKWTVDSSFSPVWVDTDAMLIAWKPRAKENGPICIPTKHIKFAKDNLSRIDVSEIGDESEKSNE